MRPRLDRSALAFGTVFLVIGIAALGQELGLWVVETGYLLPAVLIAAGLALTGGALVGDEPEP